MLLLLIILLVLLFCSKQSNEHFVRGYYNYWKIPLLKQGRQLQYFKGLVIPKNIYYEGKAPSEVYQMLKTEDDDFVYVYPNEYYPGYLPPVKKNMSRDLRGDPYIPYRQVSPWNQPSVAPIRNRSIFY